MKKVERVAKPLEQAFVPKVFISYSWSSPEHEIWVLNLAEQLVTSGVDVIFDKWDLKEGHDTYAFMEKMVNDESVRKVLIVSDQAYAEKANKRQGGVGTEALIISPKVYSEHDQEKFIVVLPSKDENGKPYLPTYYEGRMYIDLSNQEEYSKNFDMLLRNIYNKPLYVKPELGKRPSFLDEESQINLGTSVIFRRAIDAIKIGKSNISGSLNEYFTVFSENLEKFEIENWDLEKFDDQIVENIELFTPSRDELLQLIMAVIQYSPSQDNIQQIHRFLENLIPYLSRHKNLQRTYRNYMSDNFKFIIHELYLYIIAILIKHERFELANYLLTTPYYYASDSANYGGDRTTFDFTEFRPVLESLNNHRNNRLSLKRASVHADIIKQRATFKSIKFDALMQADFVLYLMGCQIETRHNWWPVTLIYATSYYHAFEIFARSKSQSYFQQMKKLFGVENTNEFKEIVSNKARVVRFSNYEDISPDMLAGTHELCTIV